MSVELSIAMIFKNEIRCLERCLKSLQPLRERISCELVIADTGSTDGSRAIAERYADVFFDFPWVNDFSAARNATLDRCSGRWALVIDCDEWLEDVEMLVRFLGDRSMRKKELALVVQRNYYTWDLDRYGDVLVPRLVNMSCRPRFIDIIHERPRFGSDLHRGESVYLDLKLHHDGYVAINYKTEEGVAKEARYSEMLRAQMEKDPENLRAMREYLDAGAFGADKLETFERAIALVRDKRPGWDTEGPEIFVTAIQAATREGLDTLDEWVSLMKRMFPDRYQTTIELPYLLMLFSEEKHRHEDTLRFGEEYLRGYSAFHADENALLKCRGIIGFASETDRINALCSLAKVHRALGQRDKAHERMSGIPFAEVSPSQINEIFMNILALYLSGDDCAELLKALWDGAHTKCRREEVAQKRAEALNGLCAQVFGAKTVEIDGERFDSGERTPRGFLLPLRGRCAYGDAAALMKCAERGEAERLLSETADPAKLPDLALAHAAGLGVDFPPEGAELSAERMGNIALLAAAEPDRLTECALAAARDIGEKTDERRLIWAHTLLPIAVQLYNWRQQGGAGWELARAFGAVETEHQRRGTAGAPDAQALSASLCRYALYLGEAFEAWEDGGGKRFADILRKGLEESPAARDIAAYLLSEAERRSSQKNASAELLQLARRLAALGERAEALRAYALVLTRGAEPEALLEAAEYTLQNEGDYKLAYSAFVSLYNAGHFRERLMRTIREAFYEPNADELRERYARNLAALEVYPYIFRKDFLPFDELPVVFFPYDDDGYVPYIRAGDRFLDYLAPNDRVVSRSFFGDLEKPVLASDVFSQYELEYLNDNVRKSEWVGRENHIYLHYADWGRFCAYLSVLELEPVLCERKCVFLIGDELSQYPIDFKARFGIDYGELAPRPVGVGEIKRIIFHTQLSSHNGGDFFNEVFDDHPNLLTYTSVHLSAAEHDVASLREQIEKIRSVGGRGPEGDGAAERITRELCTMDELTDKDIFVATFLGSAKNDPAARIAPALFFQPHFFAIKYDVIPDGKGNATNESEQAEALRSCKWLSDFKYIKTFVPMRRPTTSCAATVRFMWRINEAPEEFPEVTGLTAVTDVTADRVMNRSFMRDPEDRLFHDAVIVRLEDGKLNPEATFRALAAFIDLPYTESMTYGSMDGNRDPYGSGGLYENGFATEVVFNTCDSFLGGGELRYVEYFLRDAYKTYGYEFHAYDGEPVDFERIRKWSANYHTINSFIRESHRRNYKSVSIQVNGKEAEDELADSVREQMLKDYMQEVEENRLRVARLLLQNPRFVNRNGQPLEMIPLLRPDPRYMKRELYR